MERDFRRHIVLSEKRGRGRHAGDRRGRAYCWTFCPMSMGSSTGVSVQGRMVLLDEHGAAGRCASDGTAGHPPSAPPPTRPYCPTPRKPEPFLRTPLVKPLSTVRNRLRQWRTRMPIFCEPPGQNPCPTPEQKTAFGIGEDLSANPLVKPPPRPRPRPRQEREKHRPHAPLRGPGPHLHHLISGRGRSVPRRAAFEDDPCHGLRRLRTGGAFGSSIDTASVRQGQYPCAGSGRIFLSFHDFRGPALSGASSEPRLRTRTVRDPARAAACGSGAVESGVAP